MPRQAVRALLARAIAQAAPADAPPASEWPAIALERPRDPAHGDYATNVALLLAKAWRRPPMAIAEAIAAAMPETPLLEAVEAAPPGFVNMTVSFRALAEGLAEVLQPSEAIAWPRPRPIGEAVDLRALRHAAYAEATAGLLGRAGHPLKFEGDGDEYHHGTLTADSLPAAGTVTLLRDGKPAGALGPAALVAELGEEAVRYFCLTRPLDRPLEIDLAQARRETADNPYFSLIHAHARLSAIWRTATEAGTVPAAAEASAPEERALLLRVAETPGAFAEAARDLAPHRLVLHAAEVVAEFNRFYVGCRVFGEAPTVAKARLALVAGAREVIRSVLEDIVRIPGPADL